MRGQRVLIRPATPDDASVVASFLGSEKCPGSGEGSEALIGKVVGEVVAYVAFSVKGDELRIVSIVVAASLRRKRIGRTLVGELAQLARKMRCITMVAGRNVATDAFFQRIGFEFSGDDLVRSVQGGEPGS